MTPKLYRGAYQLAELRRFEGWASLALAALDCMGDEDVAYVWDDFTVVGNSVVADTAAPVAAPAAAWRAFSRTDPGFEVPEGLLEDVPRVS